MKSTNINSTQNVKFEFKAILNKLGSALMFPIIFFAFITLLFEVISILPRDFYLSKLMNVSLINLSKFLPYLIYISLINVFINDRDGSKYLHATGFLLLLIGISKAVDLFQFRVDIFSVIICFVIYFVIDRYVTKYNYKYIIWLLSSVFILILLLIVKSLFINISLLISYLPFGLDAFMYGFLNRLLVIVGGHSILFPSFIYSSLGGQMEIYNGEELVGVIEGDSFIWLSMYIGGVKDFGSIGSITYNDISYTYEVIGNNQIGQYQQGFIPVITFVYPILGISCYLIYGNDISKKLLIGTMFTFFTGITEPTEIMFILVNPILYLLNCIMVGLSFMLLDLGGVHCILSTGWSIDLILYGVIPSIKGFNTHWWVIPIVGVTLGIVYSSMFILIDKKSRFDSIFIEKE